MAFFPLPSWERGKEMIAKDKQPQMQKAAMLQETLKTGG
jgi:hypothetical protein